HDRGSVEYVDDLADTLTLWGESLAAQHDPAAVPMLDEARGLREPIAAARPRQAGYGRGLARASTRLGDAHAARQEWRLAQQSYQHARELWVALRERHALWASEMSYPEALEECLATAASAATCRRSR